LGCRSEPAQTTLEPLTEVVYVGWHKGSETRKSGPIQMNFVDSDNYKTVVIYGGCLGG